MRKRKHSLILDINNPRNFHLSILTLTNIPLYYKKINSIIKIKFTFI